jgi:hypothetical protein
MIQSPHRDFNAFRSVPFRSAPRSVLFRPSFHPRAYRSVARSVPGHIFPSLDISFRPWTYRSVPKHIVPSPNISFRPYISNFKLNNYLITFSQNSFINWRYIQGRYDMLGDGTICLGTERYVQGRNNMSRDGTTCPGTERCVQGRNDMSRDGTRDGTIC